MSAPKPSHIFGMTYVQMGILAVLGIVGMCLIGSLAVSILFRNQGRVSSPSLPPYTVNDVADNGENNVAYFLVADKNLSLQDAEMIIEYYREMHITRRGYLLINIWIFCDTTYANYDVLDDTTISDDEFYSHVIYWYQTGEISTAGTIFQTKPDGSYPTFGSACK